MEGRWALSNPCAATLWFATAGLAEGNARAATVNAPAWPGTATDSGTNEPGQFADITGVLGDPLKHIAVMKSASFLVRGGQVIQDAVHPVK